IFEDQISENSPIWNLEICDVNNDGIEELILGGMDGLLRVFQISSQTTLKPLWGHQFGSSVSGIRIGDINNDERYEIIAYSLDKSLRVLNGNDGSLVWGQLFEDGIEDAKIWADNNDSTKKEVLACGNDGTIRMFEAQSGRLLWFKRFSDKIRFINYINSNKGTFIICGGDDKQLHFIDRKTHEEIKTIQFENYVWKGLSFPTSLHSSLLVSSYSFDYLENSQPIQNITFSSKLICIDGNLEIVWELLNKNIEEIHPFQINHKNFIAVGTTSGELLILDNNGAVRYNINYNSCVNAIRYDLKSKLLLICYEDGLVEAFQIINDT
ncbi:MAG: WD40 repeat domain-containing protein, partial [Candidatus Thorarchaeota archaeon]